MIFAIRSETGDEVYTIQTYTMMHALGDWHSVALRFNFELDCTSK